MALIVEICKKILIYSSIEHLRNLGGLLIRQILEVLLQYNKIRKKKIEKLGRVVEKLDVIPLQTC